MIVASYTTGRKGWGWFRIKVFHSLAALREYMIKNEIAKTDDEVQAAFWGLTKPKGSYLGEMIVCLATTRDEIIHECTHAALASWRVYRKGVVIDTLEHAGSYWDDPEEQFCYLLASFTDAVIGALTALHAPDPLPVAQ